MLKTTASSYIYLSFIFLSTLLLVLGCDDKEKAVVMQPPMNKHKVEIVFESTRNEAIAQLSNEFAKLGVKGIILIENEERIRLLKPDGTYISNCNSSQPSAPSQPGSCDKELILPELLVNATGASYSDCGSCLVAGTPRQCSKSRYLSGHPKPRNCTSIVSSCNGNPCE